jgi:hypothetical protein
MPFVLMEQLHIPPAFRAQRYCSMLAVAGWLHLQVSVIPPVHFSILLAQRGAVIH